MPSVLPEGTLLAGKFRIVRLLGAGGMGAVYEIVHELTRHRRALKVLHPAWVVSEEGVQRFLREASAAGRIGNAHIIETYDAGELDGGEPYLVMELLEGETLARRIEQSAGGLPVAEAIGIVSQACAAIEAAHAAGIIHRDLKPDNVFLTTREAAGPFVKVLDFGVSKFDARYTQMAATADGAVIGTPLYMAPEQLWGRPDVDGRADVYSLGVILFECLTGVHPYPAPSIPALCARLTSGEVARLADVRPDLPAALGELCTRAMAQDRDARTASARELADALRAIVGEAPVPSDAPAREAPVDPLALTLSAPPSGSAVASPGSGAARGRSNSPPVADTSAPVSRTQPGDGPARPNDSRGGGGASLRPRSLARPLIVAVAFGGLVAAGAYWGLRGPPAEPLGAVPASSDASTVQLGPTVSPADTPVMPSASSVAPVETAPVAMPLATAPPATSAPSAGRVTTARPVSKTPASRMTSAASASASSKASEAGLETQLPK